MKLYEVFQIHKSFGTLTKFKYQSSNSFISPKFDNEISHPSCNKIMLNSNIISQWVPTSGFNFNKNEYNTFSFNQVYKKPKQIELFINDNHSICISFSVSLDWPVRRKVKKPFPTSTKEPLAVQTAIKEVKFILYP